MNDKKFTFDKNEVLNALKTNLVAHKETYAEALEDWRKATILKAREEMEKLENGKITSLRVHLDRPQDHSEDYQDFIDALEMAQETTVELSIREHKRFVKDEWEWKDDLTQLAGRYKTMSMG